MIMNIEDLTARARFWFINARPVSLPQSLMPALLGLLAARGAERFSLALGLLAVIGGVLLHLSMNLFDDYFDYRKIKAQGGEFRATKCPYIRSGTATENELLAACLTFGAAAGFCGAIIWLFRGSLILPPAVIGLILGLMYSGAPLRLSYHGLGEVVIGTIFGPLLVCGVYLSAAGEFAPQALIIGLAMGLLVTVVVYVHSMMDWSLDLGADKHTLADLLKTPERQLVALAAMLGLPYLLVLFGMACGWLSFMWRLVAISLPWALALYFSMRKYVAEPAAKVERRLWYGPMGDWNRWVSAGRDWFMLRWLLARNLLTLFAVLGALAAIFG